MWEDKIKKSKNLKSLDELGLSKKTISYLSSEIGSLEEIVWYGRYMAFEHARNPRSIARSTKATVELVGSLKKNRFVRHDAFGLVVLCFGPRKFKYESGRKQEDYQALNVCYEFADDRANEITDFLLSLLERDEYAVFMRRYGLEDGVAHEHEEIGYFLGVSSGESHSLCIKALYKIGLNARAFPEFFEEF